jgi:hypothetical protein
MPSRTFSEGRAKAVLVFAVLATLLAVPASAQYFGQNKVQYKKFDFHVLKMLRANLFGVAVGQFDLAHPLQRPGKGWLFEFNLSPGC